MNLKNCFLFVNMTGKNSFDCDLTTILVCFCWTYGAGEMDFKSIKLILFFTKYRIDFYFYFERRNIELTLNCNLKLLTK